MLGIKSLQKKGQLQTINHLIFLLNINTQCTILLNKLSYEPNKPTPVVA